MHVVEPHRSAKDLRKPELALHEDGFPLNPEGDLQNESSPL